MNNEIKEILDYLKDFIKEDRLEQINLNRYRVNQILNYITNLQDYKSRIEKAINFISKKIRDVALYGDQYFDLNELLQILQGVGKDE